MDYSLAIVDLAKKITKNEVSHQQKEIKNKYDFIWARIFYIIQKR